MRTSRIILGAAICIFAGWRVSAYGQAIPAPPAPPAAPAIPATPALPATPTPGFNLWTALCPPPGHCDKCKIWYCNSFIGQMIGSMFRPMRMMTGGLMKPCCPTPDMANALDLKKAADSPAGAAARIKQEEAEAKARRADVRYLGTVDCNRYPEAEKALIKALRTDRNECVRWEAAMSLSNGCCCTKSTVEALMLTANGSDTDGNPVETSPRVKQAAEYALAICQSRVVETAPAIPPETAPPPMPPEKAPPGLGRAQERTPPRVLPASMRQPPTLDRVGTRPPAPISKVSATQTAPAKGAAGANAPAADEPNSAARADGASVPSGQRGLIQIFMRRVQGQPDTKNAAE